MVRKLTVLCPNSCPICVQVYVLRPVCSDNPRLVEAMTCFSWYRITAIRTGMQGLDRVLRGCFDRLLLELEYPVRGGSVHPYIDITLQTFLSEFLSRLELRIDCPSIHRLSNSVLLTSSSGLAQYFSLTKVVKAWILSLDVFRSNSVNSSIELCSLSCSNPLIHCAPCWW